MSWAEVIKINSDMSKPLNELFSEHLGLGASDAPLKILLSEKKELNKREFVQLGDNFTSTVNGTVRIIGLFLREDNLADDNATIYIYEDDSLISTQTLLMDDINSEKETEYKFDINIKKGSTYSIQGIDESSVSILYCTNLKVCGSISDPTLIK